MKGAPPRPTRWKPRSRRHPSPPHGLRRAGLDLTVGRQRARWGTSDEYNVIDNLNPVDFGNLYTFDPDYFVAHLPMDGFNLEYRLPRTRP
jgi:hypothetical protein